MKFHIKAFLVCSLVMTACLAPEKDQPSQVSITMTNPDSLQRLLLHAEPLSEKCLDSISEQLRHLESSGLLPANLDNLYRDLGWKHINNHNFGEAYLAFERSLNIAKQTSDTLEEAYTLLAIGQLYMQLNQYDHAAEHITNGLQLARINNQLKQLNYAYNCIIELEFRQKNYQLAKKHALEAIKRFQNDPADVSFHFHNVLGLIAMHLQQHDEAKKHFITAIAAAKNRPEIDKGFLYGNLGSAYLSLNKLDSAWIYLDQDIIWSLERNYIHSAFSANIGKMEVFLKKGDFDPILARKLLELSDSLIEIGNLSVNPEQCKIQLDVLGQLPADQQQKKLKQMLLASSEKSFSQSQDLEQEFLNVQQLAHAIHSLKVADKELEIARKLRNAVWLSSLSVLILTIAVTWIYQLKKRKLAFKTESLQETITETKKINEQLLRQVETQSFRISVLSQENERLTAILGKHEQQTEQTTLSQEYLLTVKQKTIERLIQLWENLPEIPIKLRHSFNLALNELRQLEQAAIHLAPFIKNKNIGFEELIHEKFPELTADEIKILTYIRMNMSTSEIARLKSITIGGINKSRNRIRKKLGLSPTEDLRLYLLKL